MARKKYKKTKQTTQKKTHKTNQMKLYLPNLYTQIDVRINKSKMCIAIAIRKSKTEKQLTFN